MLLASQVLLYVGIACAMLAGGLLGVLAIVGLV